MSPVFGAMLSPESALGDIVTYKTENRNNNNNIFLYIGEVEK